MSFEKWEENKALYHAFVIKWIAIAIVDLTEWDNQESKSINSETVP